MSKTSVGSLIIFLGSLLCFLLSCLKDEECHFPYQLQVKINASPGVVDSATVYVFDSERLLKEIINVAVDTLRTDVLISLDHLSDGEYTFIVWGNLKGKQTVPDATPGRLLLEGANVCLEKKENGTYRSPDDLFYGMKTSVRDKTISQKEEVLISRCISGVIIKAYNLQKYFETSDTDFTFRVKGSLTKIPFVHTLTSGSSNLPYSGDTPYYETQVVWKQNNTLLESNMMYLFPSAENVMLEVDVLHKGKLAKTHKINSMAIPGKITEITLNYHKEQIEWFSILEWLSIYQEEEF